YGNQRKSSRVWWTIITEALENLAIDESRRKKELRFPSTEDGSHYEERIKDDDHHRTNHRQGFSETEIKVLLNDLVASGMSAEDATILIALEIQGYKQREVALMFGIPESTLSMRLPSIRQRAGKYLRS